MEENNNEKKNKSLSQIQASHSLYGISKMNGVNLSTLNELGAKDNLSRPLEQIQKASDDCEGIFAKIQKTQNKMRMENDKLSDEIAALNEQMDKNISDMNDDEKSQLNTMVQDVLQRHKELIDDINSNFEDINLDKMVDNLEKQKDLLVTFNHSTESKKQEFLEKKTRFESLQLEQNERLQAKIMEFEADYKKKVERIAQLRNKKGNLNNSWKFHCEKMDRKNAKMVQAKQQVPDQEQLKIERQLFDPFIRDQRMVLENYLLALQQEEKNLQSQKEIIKSKNQECYDKDKILFNKGESYYKKIEILEYYSPFYKEYFKQNSVGDDAFRIKGEIHKITKSIERLKTCFDLYNKKYESENQMQQQQNISKLSTDMQNIQLDINKTTQEISQNDVQILQKIQQKRKTKQWLVIFQEKLEKGNRIYSYKIDQLKSQMEALSNITVPPAYLEKIQFSIDSLIKMNDKQNEAKQQFLVSAQVIEDLSNDVNNSTEDLMSEQSFSKRNQRILKDRVGIFLNELQEGYDQLETQMIQVTAFQNSDIPQLQYFQ